MRYEVSEQIFALNPRNIREQTESMERTIEWGGQAKVSSWIDSASGESGQKLQYHRTTVYGKVRIHRILLSRILQLSFASFKSAGIRGYGRNGALIFRIDLLTSRFFSTGRTQPLADNIGTTDIFLIGHQNLRQCPLGRQMTIVKQASLPQLSVMFVA
jgi:hypothetical protein